MSGGKQWQILAMFVENHIQSSSQSTKLMPLESSVWIRSMLVHIFTSTTCRTLFNVDEKVLSTIGIMGGALCSRKLALPNDIMVLPISVVVSVEINRMHYFRSSLRVFFNSFKTIKKNFLRKLFFTKLFLLTMTQSKLVEYNKKIINTK